MEFRLHNVVTSLHNRQGDRCQVVSTCIPVCLLCGASLPDSRKRRSILSEIGCDIKRVIEDFVKQILSKNVTETQVGVLASTYLSRSTVVCKNMCCTSVMKFLNLVKS